MKAIVSMICGTAVVIVCLFLDGAAAQAVAAAFVGASGLLAGYTAGVKKAEKVE